MVVLCSVFLFGRSFDTPRGMTRNCVSFCTNISISIFCLNMVTHRIWKNTVPTRTRERLTKYFRLACLWGTLLSRCYPIISPFSPLRRKVFGTHLPKTIIHKLEAFHPSAHLLFPERKKASSQDMHLFRFLPLLPSLSGVNSGCAKIRKEERKWSWENPPPCIFLFGEPRYAWHVAMSTQRGRVIFPFFRGHHRAFSHIFPPQKSHFLFYADPPPLFWGTFLGTDKYIFQRGCLVTSLPTAV